ncbi:DUF4299 family protein [uncultured Fusobacterium sp.]|uniref:DUF4299 family protein n=1 Tax=uncultured Fusobacterium sp. TaxID=159267 RepID=UPI0025D5C463|nr:DUF4299 family protein [uncultured Fusobacterium sp.]
MSISFFIKNLRTDENISVEKILEIGRTLSQYNLDESDEHIEEFLSEELGNFDCILVGEEEKSARGFEISYDKNTKFYQIRLYTPCSIGDWETAFDFIENLSCFLENNNIIDEDGAEYTLQNIKTYPYIENIEFGIKTLTDHFDETQMEIYKVFGIYRPVAFNKKMIEDMNNSENPAKLFSDIITNIQYIDAYTANQNFYKNDNEEIFGVYTLTESVRTILPFKPSVEYENSDIVKNEDIKFWRLVLVIINGNPDDENSYEMLGEIDYTKFIENLSKDKYSFIDGEYIVIEPLTKEEINKIFKLSGELI